MKKKGRALAAALLGSLLALTGCGGANGETDASTAAVEYHKISPRAVSYTQRDVYKRQT